MDIARHINLNWTLKSTGLGWLSVFTELNISFFILHLLNKPITMDSFVTALGNSITNPYALAAYAICIIGFLLAGARIRRISSIMSRIEHVPRDERKRVIELAAETILPNEISVEEWIRVQRLRWIALLCGSIIIAVVVVAITMIQAKHSPDNASKKDVDKIVATVEKTAQTQSSAIDSTRKDVQKGVDSIVKGSDKATAEIKEAITKSAEGVKIEVQDAALANLETMFPLAVRIDRDVDGTIVRLNGGPEQRIYSYDHDMKPMLLYWGDRFHYFVFVDGPRDKELEAKLTNANASLGVVSRATSSPNSKGETKYIPLILDPFNESEVRIPGSSPRPMEAYIMNPDGLIGVSIKITVYSADRERGREEFRKQLMRTSLASRARKVYKRVTADALALRALPNAHAHKLRPLRIDTYVRVVKTDGDWSKIHLPEGREGWVMSKYLGVIS